MVLLPGVAMFGLALRFNEIYFEGENLIVRNLLRKKVFSNISRIKIRDGLFPLSYQIYIDSTYSYYFIPKESLALKALFSMEIDVVAKSILSEIEKR